MWTENSWLNGASYVCQILHVACLEFVFEPFSAVFLMMLCNRRFTAN